MDLDLLICGSHGGAATGPPDGACRFVSPEPLQSLSADALDRAVGDAACFVFVDAAHADAVSNLAAPTSAVDTAADLLFFDVYDPLRESWRQLPSQIAALIQPPASHFAVLVHKPAYEQRGPFRDVSDPIWDWLIRASRQSAINVLDSPVVGDARGQGALPSLAPSPPTTDKHWFKSHVSGLAVDSPALKAGLLQLNDFLDESHGLSQSIEGDPDGDYWHGIMHRREPDYSNAKYWFRRVGDHVAFGELAKHAETVLDRTSAAPAQDWRGRLLPASGWDPFAFVDMCQHCQQSGDGGLASVAREIQFAEMLLLLDHCYRQAAG